jgi:hypothetical protein
MCLAVVLDVDNPKHNRPLLLRSEFSLLARVG